MILYHYTSVWHLPSIFQDGCLSPVESNVSFKRQQAGPDVVWLTTKSDPGNVDMHNGLSLLKQRVRFTVDVPKRSVYEWHKWARSKGSSEKTIEILARAGGSASWRVVLAPVPSSRWVEVRDLHAGSDPLIIDAATIAAGGLTDNYYYRQPRAEIQRATV